MLGHSQITLTLGTYSQVAPELQQEAADRMGRGSVAQYREPVLEPLPKLLPLDHGRGPATVDHAVDLRRSSGAGGARTHDPGIMSPLL